MSRDQFFEFCQLNPEVRIERTAEGELIIMTPAGAESGRRNAELLRQVANWSIQDGSGLTFDSSAGFWLPNGAERSPDVAWIRRDRWDALSVEEQRKFAPLAPDFVIELRSETDRLPLLRSKMREYIEQGVLLGWLIDAKDRRVEIYRPHEEPSLLEKPDVLAGDPEMPGLIVELNQIW